jgi:SAM-dependent MidA family methyltransferase
MHLIGIISGEIKRHGSISFRRFMELALYTPGLGYYERPREIGKRGDFFTSVSVGPLFGELLARQFARWFQTEWSGEFVCDLVEVGAHDGSLARDILTAVEKLFPEQRSRIRYGIVEPSEFRHLRQREILKAFGETVFWVSDLAELRRRGGVQGVIFSNELLDAFPVNRVFWDAKRRQWREWRVGFEDGVNRPASKEDARFAWVEGEEVELENAPRVPPELRDSLPDKFTTETHEMAEGWWLEAAMVLKRGRLLAIDYGFEREEFFSPQRAAGTLRGYWGHRQVENVLERPGEIDITSHADFSRFREAGESAGLATDFMGTQEQFLTEIIRTRAGMISGIEAWEAKQIQQFKTLTHPNQLGRVFRVLVQRRP